MAPGTGDPWLRQLCHLLLPFGSGEEPWKPEHLVLTRVKNGVLWLTVFANLNMFYVGRVSIPSSFCEAILFYIFFPQIMIYLIDKVLSKAILPTISGHYPWIWPSSSETLETESPWIISAPGYSSENQTSESGGSDDSIILPLKNSLLFWYHCTWELNLWMVKHVFRYFNLVELGAVKQISREQKTELKTKPNRRPDVKYL